jgi:hypothetical protein
MIYEFFWNDEADRYLIHMYNENESLDDIAFFFCRSVKGINKRLKKLSEMGLVKRKRKVAWTDEDFLTLIKLYNENKSFEYIANELNRTVNTCRVYVSILRKKYKNVKRRQNQYGIC